jgi:hypothetical protein
LEATKAKWKDKKLAKFPEKCGKPNGKKIKKSSARK